MHTVGIRFTELWKGLVRGAANMHLGSPSGLFQDTLLLAAWGQQRAADAQFGGGWGGWGGGVCFGQRGGGCLQDQDSSKERAGPSGWEARTSAVRFILRVA